MVFTEIDHIYEETKQAVAFSNQMAQRTIFDPALIKSNLAEDVMALTARAACADGAITREELIKINKLLDEFGYGLDEDACDGVLACMQETPFEIPKTLKVLTFRTAEKIKNIRHMGMGAVVISSQYELLIIGGIIIAYANIMRYAAIESGLIPAEKRIIIDYIENCIRYVERELNIDMSPYCNYRPLLEQYNFTALHAPADGTVLAVVPKEGEAIAYHAMFAVIAGNGSSHNVLANAHGKVYKLKVKAGDKVKRNDLLAIISI